MWKRLKADESGVTLVELLAVMVIIAIFASVATPTLAGSIEKAKKERYAEEARRVAEAVQYLIIEEYSEGTYEFFRFINEVQQELKPEGSKIAQLLDGDFTPGSKIKEININNQTIHLTTLIYLVDTYQIEINFKTNTVTFQ